ncbi:MAG: hypothetical protein NMK33_03870 [Candidatus Cardinium sp.]|uniref:hypothetical protein n=1 Tax=Cardinium endosymbiont of Dermatophagoides farinae TaxID=2597823 RepID=UPI0011822303|nr:hypothetical protein [Cardinium endosymbiont of Dermatophagoides farinae]TSJ80581.1 hypothetical protein FPG78_00595 [Cardinium endosymbiont of Dermatophagoides farinae]UWW96569.1 MAG: hypothetical protein NMK33_03870 [Candidatus Cardinium sp.]
MTHPEDDWVKADMCTSLHIKAENTGNNAVDDMKRLLGKMLPLLLRKEGRESLLYEKDNKIRYFVQGSSFWNENNMKDYLIYLESQGYNNSLLLSRNAHQETSLLAAMKRGSVDMVKLLLAYTHRCVGLNPADHIDEDKNDLLDIALGQKDNRKLVCLINELFNCSARSATFTYMHFLGMAKCHSEKVIGAMLSSKKKLFYLFQAVHNNKFERLDLLLHTIVSVLGPVDCLEVFTKKYPYGSRDYTLLRTALDKNLLEEADKYIVEYLTGFLLHILEKIRLSDLSDRLKQKLIDLLFKSDIVELAKEHRCALPNLYTALRITMESISPLGEFFSPIAPSNGCTFPPSNNNVKLVLVR